MSWPLIRGRSLSVYLLAFGDLDALRPLFPPLWFRLPLDWPLVQWLAARALGLLSGVVLVVTAASGAPAGPRRP